MPMQSRWTLPNCSGIYYHSCLVSPIQSFKDNGGCEDKCVKKGAKFYQTAYGILLIFLCSCQY